MVRINCKISNQGELLGQRSMISEEPVNFAVALEDMQVCFIPKVEVMSFLKTISFQ
jgi:CRP-like cAMP-binding protein